MKQSNHKPPKFLSLLTLLAACSTPSELKKTILDQSASRPGWMDQAKTAWEEDQKIKIRGTQQIRGNERLAGCYDLARINATGLLVGEIQENIKGVLDTHETSLSENAEILLTKSRSSEFRAQASGVRFTEEFFVRYRIGDVERIDCHVLSEISKEDHTRLKRAILDKVVEADPRIKEQIQMKHIDFFKTGDGGKS